MFGFLILATKCRRSALLLLLLLLLPSRPTAFTPSRTTSGSGSNKRLIPLVEISNVDASKVLSRSERLELATLSTSPESIAAAAPLETQVRGGDLLLSSSSSDGMLEIPLPPMSQELPLIQLALAGSMATFLADLSIHPMDCIKTLQQSDQGLNWSMLDAAQYLYRLDGIHGFYHGFLIYAIADAGAGAIKFGVWESWKKQQQFYAINDPPIWFVAMGAALAFLASSFFLVPGEFLKQQLQMSHYTGFWEAVQGVAHSEGGSLHLNGLFTGYDAVLCRDIPYTVLELGMYDKLKRMLDRARIPDADLDSQGMFWDNLFCAAATGVVAAILTTPMDVIKTKLMVDNYSSVIECLLTTVHKSGIEVLYSGVIARISWIVPFTMLYLPTYDFLKNLMWERHIEHLNMPRYDGKRS